MSRRAACQSGHATADWLLTMALVSILALLGHQLMFGPLRSVYRWAADCVTLDRCSALTNF